jgi:hypothetical protein
MGCRLVRDAEEATNRFGTTVQTYVRRCLRAALGLRRACRRRDGRPALRARRAHSEMKFPDAAPMAHRARLENKRPTPSPHFGHRKYQREKLFVRRFGRRRGDDPSPSSVNRSRPGTERDADHFWQPFAPAELAGLRSRGERLPPERRSVGPHLTSPRRGLASWPARNPTPRERSNMPPAARPGQPGWRDGIATIARAACAVARRRMTAGRTRQHSILTRVSSFYARAAPARIGALGGGKAG